MLVIRRLSPDDWLLWRDLRVAALADAPSAFGEVLADWADATEHQWRKRLTDVAFNAVAFLDHSPVGQVAGIAPDAGGRVKLIALWITPAARGRGVGQPLIDAVCDWAHTVDAKAVVLSVWRTNSPAIALYERAGFQTAADPTLPIIDGAIWYRKQLS